MNASANSRRGLLAGFIVAVGGFTAFRRAGAVGATPDATEGPFYPAPSMRPPDTDNDLVKIDGVVREAGGEVIVLKGTVNDRNGAPLEGVRVEIWQCDMGGRYLHPGDDQDVPYDEGFQGFGHDVTGPGGTYSFRTIKPVSYPGRTPHIHVKLIAQGEELLTTQFYVKGHPDNSRDWLYRKMSEPEADGVSMVYRVVGKGVEAEIDIVV